MTAPERSTGVVPFGWRTRSEPLGASAAIALGGSVAVVASRLLARDDGALARLRGVVALATPALVVLGEASDLPWFDGVHYLGRDARAPSLLVPTTLEPDVPIELVERALLRRVRSAEPSRAAPPLAVLPGPSGPWGGGPLEAALLLPCGAALPLARARLRLAEAARA